MVDVLIIGSGPAGLCAAFELAKNSDLSVEVIEKGKEIKDRDCPAVRTGECTSCDPCEVMCGLGGAGGMSDGTLNLRHDIGGDLTEFTSLDEAKSLIEEVDLFFKEAGTSGEIYGVEPQETEELARKAAAAGIKFIPIKQRHIGSDNLPSVVGSLKEKLKGLGVEFRLRTSVDKIEKDCVIVEGRKIKPKFTLVAPGRSGANWFMEQARNLGIEYSYKAIDVGVRVEVPDVVMEPTVEVSRDPKFHIMTKTFDDFVRTFCTNHQGFVMEEKYDDYSCVNGHSLRAEKSNNSNFAFLSRVNLTEPVTDTMAYGRSIGRLATTIGGGCPLIQRLGDLRRGHRSTWKRVNRGHVDPTIRSVTPGDISMALPGRIVTNILEGLDQLDNVVPGVASDSTLLYAPEVKLYATRVSVKENMETQVNNLFLAGDGAGLSRDIVNAGCTGILAARGIIDKC